MKRIFVQGDSEAYGLYENLMELGHLCRDRRIGLNVGESGKIVRILCETEVRVRVHRHTINYLNIPIDAKIEIVDVREDNMLSFVLNYLAMYLSHDDTDERGIVNITDNILAWCIRLGTLASSDGFIFFPGHEDTMAHLVPIMAHIAKEARNKDKPRRRVALVGWSASSIVGLARLMGTGPDDVDWIQNFIKDEAGIIHTAKILDFVAGGFPK